MSPAPLYPPDALRAEDRALLALLRSGLGHGEPPSAPPADWDAVLALAEAHAVASLLQAPVAALPSGAVPARVREAVAAAARASAAWTLRLQSDLLRLLDAFARAGIPVLPLKGPVLASLLYAEPARRIAMDLDLLVRPQDLARSEALLSHLGHGRLDQDEQAADYHVSWLIEHQSGPDTLVELHWALGDRHLTGLDAEEVWAATGRTRWLGREVLTMSPADLLLYLCLHATKDGLGSLRPLYDLTLLLDRFGETLPWEDLARRVRRARIRRPVVLTLLHGRELLAARVPEEFLAAVRPPPAPGWLLALGLLRRRGGPLRVAPALLKGPVMVLLLFLLEDSVRGKLRHLRRNLLPSPELRARWMAQPAGGPLLRWYPLWLWTVCRRLAAQVLARPTSEAGRRAPP